ncbi:MAG: hypothetical protein NXI24_16315 [bacterium]|nr:hypothetical protein [bacterium]
MESTHRRSDPFFAPRTRRRLQRLVGTTALLLIGSAAIFTGCGETPAETRARLERLIAENQNEAVLAEINELLIENNRELSTPLNEETAPRILKRSLDGSVAAWTQSGEFHFHRADASGSVDLGDANLREFTLSYSGRYAVVLAELEKGCRPFVVSLGGEAILETPDLPDGSCYEAPVVTDDGRFFFYPEKGGVRFIEIQSAAAAGEDAQTGEAPGAPENLSSKKFPPKYKKITNQFSIEQINRRGLLIFHGSAGAYNLYFYSGSGSSVSQVKPGGKGMIARARLYSVFEGDTIASEDDPELSETDGDGNEERAPAGGAYGLDTVQAFVYAGGAGKRRLHGLRFSNPPKFQQGLPARVTQHLTFVRDRREFLILHRDHMSYWDPLRNKKSALPLVARGFVLYSGGLVYIDLLNRLYLRKQPFSPFELELMRLRKKATPAAK